MADALPETRTEAYGPSPDYTFNASLPAGVWTHLALVATPGQTQLYFNGTLMDTLATSVDLPLTSLGNSAGDRPRALVDDLFISNRALAPWEVQAIANASF